MRKSLVLFTAAMLASSTLSGAAVARDRIDRAELSANQMNDQFNARTARIKADLRLTPEQDKNWAGFESAMKTMGKQNADREIARRDDMAQRKAPIEIIEQMRLQAKYLGERSVDRKNLADAAAPLYASLDDLQKKRFGDELVGISRGREDN
jgi:hypothetical protein